MKTIKKVFTAIVTSLFIGSALLMSGCTTSPIYGGKEIKTTEDIQALVDRAKLDGINSVDITEDNEAVIKEATEDALSEAKKASDAEEARLQAIIDDYKAEAEQVQTEDLANANAYTLDELELGATFNYELSDREIPSLFDGKVKLGNKNYDAEEVLNFDGKIGINEEDYNGVSYLEVREGELTYTVQFDDALNTSDIDEDKTLKFKFLGEDVEVSEWDVDSVSFTKGDELFLKEGESAMVGDKSILVRIVNDNYVYVQVGVDSRKINEGDTEEIGGLEVEAVEVLVNDEGDDYVVLKLGEEVLVEVEDGDEYEEDDRFEWKIDANSIGLVLKEDYDDLDNKNYKPLKAGESLLLPNDFKTITFDGLTEVDTQRIDIEDDNDYDMEISGKFIDGLEDYDRVFVNSTGIYDEDDKLIGTSVEIDNTDSILKVVGNTVKIGNITVALNFSDIKDGANSIKTFDETYLNNYGITVSDPEDGLDNKDLTIVVPEEEVQAEVTIK